MTTNLEERAMEWLIEWNNKQALHPSQDKCTASLAALLTQVQAEARDAGFKDGTEWKRISSQAIREATVEEIAQWLERNHRDDEDEQWEACCNLPEKIRALAAVQPLTRETK